MLLSSVCSADDATGVRVGMSVAVGHQAPIKSTPETDAWPATAGTSLSFALALRVPLTARLAVIPGIGVTYRTWSNAHDVNAASDDRAVLLFTAQGVVRSALSAEPTGLYVGSGLFVGSTNEIDPPVVAIPTDTRVTSPRATDSATPKRHVALGPIGEVGARVGPEGILDVGVRVMWLTGLPGSPVSPMAYVGAWF